MCIRIYTMQTLMQAGMTYCSCDQSLLRARAAIHHPCSRFSVGGMPHFVHKTLVGYLTHMGRRAGFTVVLESPCIFPVASPQSQGRRLDLIFIDATAGIRRLMNVTVANPMRMGMKAGGAAAAAEAAKCRKHCNHAPVDIHWGSS